MYRPMITPANAKRIAKRIIGTGWPFNQVSVSGFTSPHTYTAKSKNYTSGPATDPFGGGAMGQPTFPRRFRPAPAR